MHREILVVGLSHHTAPVEVREQLAFGDGQLEDAYRRLLAIPEVEEGVILSTCNRVEVVSSTAQAENTIRRLKEFLQQSDPTSLLNLEPHIYAHRMRDAVRHLFRVAASLDSMVVGEPQILGQLKESYTRASAIGATGTILHRCFHKAFSVAKRVRAETAVASRSVSVSSAAVELARKIFDKLEDKTAMLIGAGRMSELAARHLLSHGVGGMIVTNRTFDRAIELAKEFRATPVPFEQLPRYLRLADVVIGSTAAEEFVVSTSLVHDVLRERNQRPMFFIDLSVPRNFDPRINEIDNVYIYDIDDLEGVIEGNLGERMREAAKAEEMVEHEVDSFCHWLGALDAVPTIVALRRKLEEIRKGELEKSMASLRQLGDREREVLEAMTSAIINKILHTPISKLKHNDNSRTEAYFVDAARRLFDLDESEEE